MSRRVCRNHKRPLTFADIRGGVLVDNAVSLTGSHVDGPNGRFARVPKGDLVGFGPQGDTFLQINIEIAVRTRALD